jgi:hypothetical protein
MVQDDSVEWRFAGLKLEAELLDRLKDGGVGGIGPAPGERGAGIGTSGWTASWPIAAASGAIGA